MNGDVVSQFWVDIWAVVIVKVTGIDSCIRDLGTLNQKLGHCLWPRHNNGAHTTSAATELNSLKMLIVFEHFKVNNWYQLFFLNIGHWLVCFSVYIVGVNWKTIVFLFQQLTLSHH